ncbi:MAG TPA: protein kinase, partial [Planctomycetaceae bacterium]|nr:protein kinase [Planctomycetaceae bacterium]
MHPTSTPCNTTLLQRSLEDQLSEQQEEQLAAHLTECEACRRTLETMAADVGSWSHVGKVLRDETSGEHAATPHSRSTLIPRKPLSGDDNDEDFHDGSSLKPSDFIVDFLQPAQNKESLGRLGNIEIRQFIGQGAHGIVLKGFQEELNRLVAVKVMAPHLASVAAARKRFAREARAAAAIMHPNVLPILHVDSSGQLPFLVMPYVDCESLQDRLDRDGALPILDVLRIAVQVARGLAAAHAQGLVHRDVKPANILLERGVERVMLTDFGLARAVDDATLTRSGLIAGTPHYMSPEQARGEGVDTRSDLFSLGSVLYAMTTGRPPFRAETTYGILRRVTDDAPRAIREHHPETPDWFEGIVLRLLHKSPDKRFSSADEIAQLLEDCLAHAQQPAAIPLPAAARALSAMKEARLFQKAGLLIASALLGVLAIAAFVIYSAWPRMMPCREFGFES